MHALGLRKGDHVAILMGNDEHWIALFYGAALLGAVTVPVNTRFKAAELEFCLQQADCKSLFYAPAFLNNDFAAMVRAVKPRLAKLAHAVPVDKLRAAPFVPAEVKPDDLLLIQFTSGTTAYPKGVMLTHDSMLRNAAAAGERMGVKPEDRYFNCRPFFHVGGSTLSALVCLVHGACLVTLPAFEAGTALATMEKERCTLTSGNDTIFQMLMGHEDFPQRKLVLRGGWAAAGPETMKRIIHVLGARQIRLRAVGSLSQRGDERLARSRRAARAGPRHAAPRHAIAHRGWRDPGARLERDARLLQQSRSDGAGFHRRRLAAHRGSR
jgi:fatty-acyl-CoA synthase